MIGEGDRGSKPGVEWCRVEWPSVAALQRRLQSDPHQVVEKARQRNSAPTAGVSARRPPPQPLAAKPSGWSRAAEEDLGGAPGRKKTMPPQTQGIKNRRDPLHWQSTLSGGRFPGVRPKVPSGILISLQNHNPRNAAPFLGTAEPYAPGGSSKDRAFPSRSNGVTMFFGRPMTMESDFSL